MDEITPDLVSRVMRRASWPIAIEFTVDVRVRGFTEVAVSELPPAVVAELVADGGLTPDLNRLSADARLDLAAYLEERVRATAVPTVPSVHDVTVDEAAIGVGIEHYFEQRDAEEFDESEGFPLQ